MGFSVFTTNYTEARKKTVKHGFLRRDQYRMLVSAQAVEDSGLVAGDSVRLLLGEGKDAGYALLVKCDAEAEGARKVFPHGGAMLAFSVPPAFKCRDARMMTYKATHEGQAALKFQYGKRAYNKRQKATGEG